MSDYYLGLISGTSMDGIDAALIAVDQSDIQLVHRLTYDYEPQLAHQLQQLCEPGENEINQLGACHRQVAKAFATAAHACLAEAKVDASRVKAIGSHGQTIRHHPSGPQGFSLQIGCPSSLAVQTGIPVIADFRSKDIALGGEGAPLVPAFHKALFQSDSRHRVIVNIGGIANLTALPPTTSRLPVIGFDTGPGNRLLDSWCQRHQGSAYDRDGAWGAQGETLPALLKLLLTEDYLQRSPPKSTGRELFNEQWLAGFLQASSGEAQTRESGSSAFNAVDVQATLTTYTAVSIHDAIRRFTQAEEVYVCGGGAYNRALMQHLRAIMPDLHIDTTDCLGAPADCVEAMAFAWLAYAHCHGLPGNVPSVTGASREAVLGAYCPV